MIVIQNNGKLVIDKGDTKWLKMLVGHICNSDGDSNSNDENGEESNDGEEDSSVPAIIVRGSLSIDSVKITSRDSTTNDYVKFESDILPGREFDLAGIGGITRPYIRVESDEKGTTNIANSELAYLPKLPWI